MLSRKSIHQPSSAYKGHKADRTNKSTLPDNEFFVTVFSSKVLLQDYINALKKCFRDSYSLL